MQGKISDYNQSDYIGTRAAQTYGSNMSLDTIKKRINKNEELLKNLDSMEKKINVEMLD